jgi:hypothetical protein
MSRKRRSPDLSAGLSAYRTLPRPSYLPLLLLVPALPLLAALGALAAVALVVALAAFLTVLTGSPGEPSLLAGVADQLVLAAGAACPVLLGAACALSIKRTRALPQVSSTAAAVLTELDALAERTAPLAPRDASAGELLAILVTTRQALLEGLAEVFTEHGGDPEHPAYAQARDVVSELSAALREVEDARELRRAARVAAEVAAARLARRSRKVSPALAAVLEDARVRAGTLRLETRDAALAEAAALTELTSLAGDLFEGTAQPAGPSDASTEVALPREPAQRAPLGRETS